MRNHLHWQRHLPPDLTEVRAVAIEAGQFITHHDWTEAEVSACELALVEACNNAIHHASPEDEPLDILVDVVCDAVQVEMRVFDHTAGFEWPQQTALPDDLSEEGRGLFLISSLMDRVSYLKGTGENCLIMVKHRADQAPATAERPAPDRLLQYAENELMIRDMVEELSSCYESMSAVFRYSSELVKNSRVSDFSCHLLNNLLQITASDWFLLRLRQGNRLVTNSASHPAVAVPDLDLSAPGVSPGTAEAMAVSNRQDVAFDPARPLAKHDPMLPLARDSQGFIHPFYYGDELIGTLTIGKSMTAQTFRAAQENVVHTFADFLAIQVANARFQEELISNRLVSRELEIAKSIQRSLLPKHLPQLPGFGLAGACESAHQVGGDFFDALRLSEHGVLLIIADVMGKGVPAAMFAAILRSLLRAVPELRDQPAALLTRVNHLLFSELSGVDMFITAELVHVDVRQRRLVAASAGHCPLVVWAKGQAQAKLVSPEGMPLGILPDTVFADEVLELPSDCSILLYTDGITDASNARGDVFGQARLLRWLEGGLDSTRRAVDLRNDLVAELAAFEGGITRADDQTFLILVEEPSAPSDTGPAGQPPRNA